VDKINKNKKRILLKRWEIMKFSNIGELYNNYKMNDFNDK